MPKLRSGIGRLLSRVPTSKGALGGQYGGSLGDPNDFLEVMWGDFEGVRTRASPRAPLNHLTMPFSTTPLRPLWYTISVLNEGTDDHVKMAFAVLNEGTVRLFLAVFSRPRS